MSIDREEAMKVALTFLNRRERTASEVTERLLSEGSAPDLAADVVDELIGLGAIDDLRYARLFAEDKRHLSGWGPERIRLELVGRGVGAAEIEPALAAESREEAVDRAAELLAARGPVEGPRDRERAVGFLQRRGFDPELAWDALRRLEASRHAA